MVEIDLSTGSLWDDVDSYQSYRAETLDYVRLYLGLSCDRDRRSVKPSLQIIRGFEVIGKALRNVYNVGGCRPLIQDLLRRTADQFILEQLERLSKEMEVYMEMSEQEQRVRLNGALPSVEEFWEYRLGSSAVGVCLAVLEYIVSSF